MAELSSDPSASWLTWPQIVEKIDRELDSAPSAFLQKHWISKTMHPSSRPLSELYAKALGKCPYWDKKLYLAACDPPFGEPYRYEADPAISPQSLQHGFYLNMLHEHWGLDASELGDIVEIGGGYGNMARIIRQLGHRGRYQIADLPEIHRLQRHYLDHVLPGHGVEFISNDQIDGGDFLMATFSVSEMPLAERKALEPKYAKFRRLMFATTFDFKALKVYNVDYFEGLAKRLGGKFFKDPHRSAWFVLCER